MIRGRIVTTHVVRGGIADKPPSLIEVGFSSKVTQVSEAGRSRFAFGKLVTCFAWGVVGGASQPPTD